MCGFCGISYLRRGGEISSDVIQKMTSALYRRGPDDEGIYISSDKKIGLGHRRLSIIDLSKLGHQPMSNEDRSAWIVFNGEIYNFKKLRKELEERGHHFKSQTDTEVIIHLYEDYGEGCVKYLRGMFAFAIWDEKQKRLFVVRDRLGIKPLFYFSSDNVFIFASEIKALLLYPEVEREINPKALDCYITFGYIPAPLTIFKGIYKLPQASILTFNGEELSLKKYWGIDYTKGFNASEGELKELLTEELKDAVKSHLVSDVPLGAFLSGGIDSSSVVALMAEETENLVDTFSIGFGKGDELAHARLVAKRYATNHHEFVVRPDVTELLPEIVWFLDEPLFDNSIIPTYLISQYTKDHVKVALSGDGGDELFAGYQWTRRYEFYRQYKKLPSFVKEGLKKIFINSKKGIPYGTDLFSRAQRLLTDTTLSLEDGFARRTSIDLRLKEDLYSESLKEIIPGHDPLNIQRDYFAEAMVKDEREKMLYVDTMMYLPDDILFKVDRMSMAHSLEVRVPFLDHKVVELSVMIPFELKIKRLRTKYILKWALKDKLPRKTFRQRKQGFTLPLAEWFRGELKQLVSAILLSEEFKKRGFFNIDTVRMMLEGHISGRQDFTHRIMNLLIFEIWARLFIDRRTQSIPSFSLREII